MAATPSPHSGRGLPLRLLLSVVLSACIAFAAGGVAIAAYVSGKTVVDRQWNEGSARLADLVTARTRAFLGPAIPFLHLAEGEARAGRLRLEDPDTLLSFLEAGLQANPRFTWVCYGDAQGRFWGASRTGTGGLELAGSTPQGTDPTSGATLSLRQVYLRGADGRWRPDGPSRTGAYDPRDRPWYHAGLAQPEGAWVSPYLFSNAQQPGFSYAVAQRNAAGEVVGVWTVDYELAYLSEFLGRLEVGERGRVYVLTRGGKVVGHPAGEVTVERAGKREIARADDHADAMLAGAWTSLDEAGRREAHTFAFPGHVAMVRPFPPDSGIDLIVLTVIPEDDLFGDVYRELQQSAFIAGALALLAILGGVLFARRVSRELRELSRELERIGRFELSAAQFAGIRSPLREVNAMNEATTTMRQGLRSFAKYVPADLVRQLLQHGEVAQVGGHTRELTVMFADIAGFTTIAEGLSPDELLETLAEFLEAMGQSIRAHRGTVDKYLGDAIMAFWGAPEPLETHALLACQAALEMRRRLRVLQEQWRAAGRPVFQARMGVNTGPMLVGNVGSPDRLNYTVMGDAVNLASRLEGLNKPYGTEIMLGEATAAAVADAMLVRPLDFVAVKGKSQAILVYELVESLADATPAQREGVAAYRAGLEHYRARRFSEARAELLRADETLGEDAPARLLAERCAVYAASPPPEGWDGRTTMTAK